ncbi:unnamed protein product [Oppiella nova]|uniref:Chitin-binding type-4 domain-containing protein n=1 Tax=Oppiella nova TaxID=334625 RepID=A0A7R9LY68_9ACAR|nr:unnamed protein product [Oppiella nova]CAG2167422.1 unnamed protein product [Oppiella nova]
MNGPIGHCSESSAILDEPPSRSSAWRFFFNTSQNPLDGYTNCGGFDTQWNLNQGKCGVCGDPYNAPVHKHRWVIPTKDNDVIYAFRVKLPVGLTCERCVFQWTWITNERAGDKQTTHKACADVKIIN